MEPSEVLLTTVNEILVRDYEEEYFCQVLDGEAYVHGWSLQKIVKAAKKYRPELTDKLEYHIFDLCIPSMRFDARADVLYEAYDVCVEQGEIDPEVFKLVPDTAIDTEEQLIEIQGAFLTLGFEGVMVRHASSSYAVGHRSPDLFKFKKFFDMECEVVGVWEDNNGNAMFKCRMKDGGVFDCTPKRTQ